MKKLHSIQTLALVALAGILTTGTLRATVYIYGFFPSVPIVQNQSCSLSISVGYNKNPNGWSGTIDWGDGTTTSAGGFFPPSVFFHTYTTLGSYTISFNGSGAEYDFGGFFNSRRDFSNAIGASTGITVVPAPPSFTLSPTNQVLFPGSNAVFTATVSSTVPVLLQWLKNGTNFPNATNASLTITNVQVANEGTYSLFATNVGGTNISSAAALVVRRPLKIVFGGFSLANTFHLTVTDADGSPIDALRISTISILTKTNLNPATSWQPLGTPPSLNSGALQLDSPVLPPAQNFYRAVETP